MEQKHNPNNPAKLGGKTAGLALCLQLPLQKVVFSADLLYQGEGGKSISVGGAYIALGICDFSTVQSPKRLN